MTDKEMKEVFPYTYSGGGYFRENKPQGQKADILHGMEAIRFVISKLEELNYAHRPSYGSQADA